jgi:hypothetical protein
MTSAPRYSLLKALHIHMPRNAPFSLSELEKIGISTQRAASYAKSGWLERVSHGTYMFPNQELSLTGSLSYLAKSVPGLHIGGASSLMLEDTINTRQYQSQFILWGNQRYTLPKWFTSRFPSRYVSANIFDLHGRWSGAETLIYNDTLLPGIRISIPERAILEFFYEAETHQGLNDAQQLIFDVKILNFETVGLLLERCVSVKAIRLLLAWVRQTGYWDADDLLTRYDIRVGSDHRWITRLKAVWLDRAICSDISYKL